MSNLKNIVIALPIIASLSLIFRSILPYQNYISLFLLSVFFIWFFFSFPLKTVIKINWIIFKRAWLLLLISSIYIFVILISDSINPLLFKELYRTVSIIIVFFAFSFIVANKGVSYLISNFIKLYIVYLTLAVINFIYSFYIGSKNGINTLNEIDYNMFALFLLIGNVFISKKLLTINVKYVQIIIYNILLSISSILIVLSNSRRALIILILLHFVLFIFIIFNKKIFYIKRYTIYLCTIIVILLSSVLFLNNSNLRFYLLRNHTSNNFSNHLNLFTVRTFSIFGANPYNLEFFPEKNLLNSIMTERISKKVLVTKKFSSNYYDNLNYLALFTESKERLTEFFPIADLIPDSLFGKQKIINLPEVYNVDYTFGGYFIPISFENCYFNNFDLNKNDSVFHFVKTDINKNCRILSILPVSDSSFYTLTFNYYNKENKPTITFDSFSNSFIDYNIVQDTVIKNKNNTYTKHIDFIINNTTSSKIKTFISFKNKEIYISDINLYRKRISRELLYSPIKYENKLSRRKAIITGLLFYNSGREQQLFSANIKELLSLHSDLLNATLFSKYDNSLILEAKMKSALFVNKNQKEGFIRKLIPAFPNQVYSLSFKTNIPKNKLVYYIKRFPEVNPEYIKTQRLNDVDYYIKEGMLHLTDSFKVINSSSLQSLLIIGSTSTDTFIVKDFKLNIYKKSENFSLNKRQKKFAKTLKSLANEAKINVLKEKQDSLLDYYNIQKHHPYENLFITRLTRWKFAYYYFKKFDISKKLFGDNLKYLDIFPVIFYQHGLPKLTYDYPHNPLLSSFLYSGICGALVYIYFLLFILYIYIKKIKEVPYFFLAFILSFIFAFFSGNSQFSIPIFAILSLYPFLITKKNKNNDQ
ncbi:MAG: hypothetical protein KAT68_07565 [Bacteroidales bacterium]|nr:hypothetical protein [Bacteroidales bacterium]